MTLDTLIMLAGVFVATLPFLGFPNSWDTVLLFIIGVVIIGFGVMVRRERNTESEVEPMREREAFVENQPR